MADPLSCFTGCPRDVVCMKIFKPYSRIETLIITACIIAAGILYAGFYFPDPYAFRTMGHFSYRLLYWSTRVGVPVVIVFALFLYHFVKTSRISGVNVLISGGSLFIAILMAYPVVAFLYYHSSELGEKSAEFHPYFQLTPYDFSPRGKANEPHITIMCLGGSTTEFKDSSGQGWPDRVEMQLRKHYANEAIYVYNMGRQWYTIQHTLFNYEVNLRYHKPDIIIVMHAINDLLQNADFSYFSFKDFRQDYGHFYGPLKRIMTRKTFEYSLFSKFRSLWYHKPRKFLEQKEFPGIVPFERNMNSLIDLTSRDKTDMILMTQPNLFKHHMSEKEVAALDMVNYEAIGPEYQWTMESARLGMERYNAATRKIAVDRQIWCIDLESRVPKTLEYFHDDVHYQDIAFDVVADAVTSGLIKSGIIDKKINSRL